MSAKAIRLSQSIIVDGFYLAVLDVCEFECGYIITRIHVPKQIRMQGYGKSMLTKACAAADRLDVSLYLEVNAYEDGGMSNEQLTEWYRSFGFEEFEQIMRRSPQ